MIRPSTTLNILKRNNDIKAYALNNKW